MSQNETWGNASRIKATSQTPNEFSGFVLTYEGPGHIAFYTRLGDTLFLSEANYVRCKVTQRQLKIGDPVIRGYR